MLFKSVFFNILKLKEFFQKLGRVFVFKKHLLFKKFQKLLFQ